MKLQPETIERKYFSIGSIAGQLNVTPPTIRFWCAQFDIKPDRRRGHRKFTPGHVSVLKRIKALHDTGIYTVNGIRWMLSSDSGY